MQKWVAQTLYTFRRNTASIMAHLIYDLKLLETTENVFSSGRAYSTFRSFNYGILLGVIYSQNLSNNVVTKSTSFAKVPMLVTILNQYGGI